MRPLRFAFVSICLPVVCCLGLSSCATQMAINAAQGNPAGATANQPNYRSTSPNPAFYALVPLAIPFDIVTLPFQFIYANVTGQPFTGAPVAPAGSQPPPSVSQPAYGGPQPSTYGAQPVYGTQPPPYGAAPSQ